MIKEAQAEKFERLKAERKKRRKAEKSELLRLAEKRKKKDVRLNTLKSISGSNMATKQTCHRCGKVGHIKADCPERNNRTSQDSSTRKHSLGS